MKRQIATGRKREFEAALVYYKGTVWSHVRNLSLTGAQYDVALRAWERLDTAQRIWSDSLDWKEKGMAAEVDIKALRPRRLERDGTLKPETLASIASVRLGEKKPKSIIAAVEEGHDILRESADYLRGLPEPKTKPGLMLRAYFNRVSFDEILASSEKPKCFPLLRTVQENRNGGKLTSRALSQAVKRHPDKRKKIQKEIREALKNKEISCRLLEEIRWRRFRRRFKG